MKLKKNNAFTLIETLVSFFLTLMVVTLFFLFFHSLNQINSHIFKSRDQEWEMFLIILEKTIENCEEIQATNDTFFCKSTRITNKKEEKRIELKKGRGEWINFSINGGTMILLSHVKKVSFSLSDALLSITVSFTDGERRNETIKLSKIE